ncbi:MAG TPA: hypothetical protein VLV50_10085 [Stellaceae bacterium]|nr:hypothetical protein [Stellaceae bacterium]
MRQEPKSGPDVRTFCAMPVQGRLRPEEILRRKLMQKMMARRERRAAAQEPVRRAG